MDAMGASDTKPNCAAAILWGRSAVVDQVMRILGRAVVTLAALFLGLSLGRAESISIVVSEDTTLLEIAPDNALGGAVFFNSGTTALGTLNRALLYFDLTGLIPAGAQVTSVSLSMDVVRQPAVDPVASLFGLRRVLTSWGEGSTIEEDPGKPGKGGPAQLGDATWNHRSYSDSEWFAPGGAAGVDFSTEISAATVVYGQGDLVMFDSTPQMLSDVQFWLQHPESNFGWMLKTEEELQPRTARSFASRESGYGPTLNIDFVVVPEPATWCFVGLAVGLLSLAHRRR
jgi:hypothetical protein